MIKIKIRTLFLFIMLLIAIKLFTEYKYDKRPFKFESYQTFETFKREAKNKFFIGANISYATDILQDSGARCTIWLIDEKFDRFLRKDILNDAVFMVECHYESDLISLYQYACYHVDIQINKDLKILHTSTNRIKYCGMWVI